MEEKDKVDSVVEKEKSKSHSTSYTSYTSYTRGKRSKNYYSNPVPPYFKLTGLALGLICIVGLFISVTLILNFNGRRDDLTQKGIGLKAENDILEAQRLAQNIKAFEDVLLKVYPDETDLYNVVKANFEYSMKINGTFVNKENYNRFDVTSSDLTIEFIEAVKDNTLPASVMKKASVFSPDRTKTKQPVTISGTTQFETETVEEANSTTVIWRFKGIQIGEIVSVFFNEYSLVEALDIEANSFEIYHTRDK